MLSVAAILIWVCRGRDSGFETGLSRAVAFIGPIWISFRGAVAVLPRRCSQFHRHVPEGRQKRERLRQVYDHAPR